MTALGDHDLDAVVRRHAATLKARLEGGATSVGSIRRRAEDRRDRRRRVVAGALGGLVVVSIVVVGLARGTFVGVQNSANDRAAQSNLTNALTELSALYQTNHSFNGITLRQLDASAPEFRWTTGPVSAYPQNAIGIYVQGQVAVLTDLSAQLSTCWYLLEVETTGPAVTRFGVARSGVYYKRSNGGQRTCRASAPPPGRWAGSYSSALGPS